MAVLMIPLMFFPRFLLILSDFEVPLTPLERFLSHQLGILLLALAAGTVMAVSIAGVTGGHRPNSDPI
jgi:hypothetical protein